MAAKKSAEKCVAGLELLLLLLFFFLLYLTGPYLNCSRFLFHRRRLRRSGCSNSLVA